MTDLQVAVKNIVENNGGRGYAQEVLKYGCQSGCVPELIYYKDTYKWFDTYYEDIMDLKERYEDMGCKIDITNIDIKNWFAWFSFEQTLFELYGD